MPFQEGYAIDNDSETHIFTDFRWTDGLMIRRWHVDPVYFELVAVDIRPFSVSAGDERNQ